MPKEWSEKRQAWVWVKEEMLSQKERKFVEAFDGDVDAAARAAGATLKHGRRMLMNPLVVREIEKKNGRIHEQVIADKERGAAKVFVKNARLIAGAIAAKEDRQAFWTKVMMDEEQNMAFRLKAAELLGKAQGDFIERHEHAGAVLMVVNPYAGMEIDRQRAVEAEVVKEEKQVEQALLPEDPYAS